ncbi:MAG: hypothetical protein ACPGVK_05265 [Halocynthiibacter sp.]
MKHHKRPAHARLCARLSARIGICLTVGAFGVAGFETAAQTGSQKQTPMSAIDWLTEGQSQIPSKQIKRPIITGAETAEITEGITDDVIEIIPLDDPDPDGAGLLPRRTTGLPAGLWEGSNAAQLSEIIKEIPAELSTPMRGLYLKLLLAETTPPQNAAPTGAFLAARLSALYTLGALEEPITLAHSTAAIHPSLYALWLRGAMIQNAPDEACEFLTKTPRFAPNELTRATCLVRTGSYDTASILLDAGRSLGTLSASDAALLDRYLTPELAEGKPPLPAANPISATQFFLHAAIGEPLPTDALPLVYAHADLDDFTGWKAKLHAAERLAKAGAIPTNQLLGVYSERTPSASGGVWERVEALQRFDIALKSGDPIGLSKALSTLDRTMRDVGLEEAMARSFGGALADKHLIGDAKRIAFRYGLLNPNYEEITANAPATSPEARFLIGVSRGAPDFSSTLNQTADTIAAAFKDSSNIHLSPATNPIYTTAKRGALGEALLLVILECEKGLNGDLKALGAGLRSLRALGLENEARGVAIRAYLKTAFLPPTNG